MESVEKAFVQQMIQNLKDDSDESHAPILSKLKASGLGIGERLILLDYLIVNKK
jgi:hypothetical protein